jgi:hypothetical protein
MPSTTAVTNFDYNNLDSDTASFVQQQTGEIRTLMRRTTEDLIRIGQKLIEIKKRLGHGNYGNWLKAEFAWSEQNARRFTYVAENFGDKSNILLDLNFAQTALFTLSAPSVSQEAREEFLVRSQAGEYISTQIAEEIKGKYSFKKPKKSAKNTQKNENVRDFTEVIDAELEEAKPSPPPKEQKTAQDDEIVTDSELSNNGNDAIALPPSPSQWWRLSGKKQTHLLFNGHPDAEEFRARSPQRAGLKLSFPSTPQEEIIPTQKILANVSFSFSTIYTDLNLNLLRQTLETLLYEASSEEDKTAIVIQFNDAPLLALLDGIEINCFIAEPDKNQCETILSVWQQLGGEVEKLDTSPA